MKPLFFALLFTLPLLILSCKSELEQPATASSSGSNTHRFDTCQCSISMGKENAKDYLKADIDGVPMCFEIMPQMNDTFPNMMIWGYITDSTGGRKYYDNLCMLRNAANSNWQLAIFLENTHALTKSYPYQLPRANPEVCEIGELQVNNTQHYSNCAWCTDNTYNYFASFFANGVSLTATSFDNNVFTGTFSGTAKTGSGNYITITNGSFSVHLIVFQSDIHL